MSDSENEDNLCDRCDKETKIRSLLMGGNGYWGKGEMLCAKCLNEVKTNCYLVNHSGRRMFCTSQYYTKYWRNEKKN